LLEHLAVKARWEEHLGSGITSGYAAYQIVKARQYFLKDWAAPEYAVNTDWYDMSEFD
jgi:hypothetical protein